MRIGISWVVALACSSLAPFEARAQLERCGNDTLSPQEAEARVEWARRCALNKVGSPSQGFDVGTAGASMIDYQEVDASGYPSQQNAYQGDIMNFEVNATYSYALFSRTPSSQVLESNGYYKWVSSSKRQFPYFPSFGSLPYVDPSNAQLYPHPNLSDCNLYTDRSGYNRASTFYVNMYCGATSTRLTNGVPLLGQSGGDGSEKRYTVVVPEGSAGLYISTGGGWGNANLYVRREAAATTSAYECASTYGGNYDSCYFSSPTPGTYHVLVKGATGGYGDVSVRASWNELQRSSPIYNLYAGWGVEKHYSFSVPYNNITDLDFWISGGTGDADIYVRYGAPPTQSQYDCRPFSGTNSETCHFSYPSGGTWYVMVRAWSTYSGVSLTANYTEYVPPPDPCSPYTQDPMVRQEQQQEQQEQQAVPLQPDCPMNAIYCPPVCPY